jgi:hypothetical protein
MGLMKFTTWMLAEAKFKYKATQGQNPPDHKWWHPKDPDKTYAKNVTGEMDAENEKDAAAKLKASGMFAKSIDGPRDAQGRSTTGRFGGNTDSEPKKPVSMPRDNLDSDQDGTKNSKDSTPKDEPKKPDIRPGGHQEVPNPAEKAKILGNEKLQRQGLGRRSFKIHGRSSAVGRTDPSRGVGAYKNAVGLGDVVDYIGAKGPGGVPDEVAQRAKIRGQQAVAKATKIANDAKAEDDARAAGKVKEKKDDDGNIIDSGKTSVKGTAPAQGTQMAQVHVDKEKAFAKKRKEEREAATTAEVTPRGIASARILPSSNSLNEEIKQIFNNTNIRRKR